MVFRLFALRNIPYEEVVNFGARVEYPAPCGFFAPTKIIASVKKPLAIS